MYLLGHCEPSWQDDVIGLNTIRGPQVNEKPLPPQQEIYRSQDVGSGNKPNGEEHLGSDDSCKKIKRDIERSKLCIVIELSNFLVLIFN